MKGKKFLALFRDNGSPAQRLILNGRGEKKRFLRNLKPGVQILDVARIRKPLNIDLTP